MIPKPIRIKGFAVKRISPNAMNFGEKYSCNLSRETMNEIITDINDIIIVTMAHNV